MSVPLAFRMTGARVSRRGATRRGAPGASAVLVRRLVPLLFAVLLLAAGELGFKALREVANVPIKQVSVNGDFRFLDKTQVEEIILPHLGTGYFLVDLPKIRDGLQKLPLVHEVTIRRAWPDRLLVFITEQVPVLRFGEKAYLNPYAEVFEPGEELPGLELPTVNGPAGTGKLLLRTFDQFTELLEPLGLRIATLSLDGKHAWRLVLNNGTEVLLGRREVESKLRTLIQALGGALAGERDRITRIDMRYSNGMAVMSDASDQSRNVRGSAATGGR